MFNPQPALLHSHLFSPTLALKATLRAAQISQLNITLKYFLQKRCDVCMCCLTYIYVCRTLHYPQNEFSVEFFYLLVLLMIISEVSTIERQCLGKSQDGNTTLLLADGGNSSVAPPCQVQTVKGCSKKNIFYERWPIFYFSYLTCDRLVLPLMQSYIKAGDFTVRGKLRSALVDNAIYYSLYLFICGILLVYIALQPSLELDGQKLKVIASSASNTWGLFLLVLLLGYGLVQVPRSLWNAGRRGYLLQYSYFRAAKLSAEKCEAEETVDDILESLQAAAACIGPGHMLHKNLETIFQKVPIELRERMGRRQLPPDTPTDAPSYKALVRLHRQILKALQTQHRTETQWGLLVDQIICLEDVACNQVSHEQRFRPTFQPVRSAANRLLCGPVIEWYWKCVIRGHVLKLLSVVCGTVSLAVVWSEVTFFNKEPVLSLFAQFVNLATTNNNYVAIQVVSTLIIAYLCYCAYSTVLRIRFLNLYYLAPHHQTDEYSLIFAGMMLCRLTPPMCLNFLGLIHMDSHIIKIHISETYYTQVMGHMDVVSIISDGFNVYFPMAMVVFCLATYFNIGSRLLSALGFHQFLGDDEVTSDLVDEGRELIKREKRRRQRAEDSVNRRREFQERYGSKLKYRATRQNPEDRVRALRRDDSAESARAVLLRDVEPVDCYSGSTMNSASTEGSDRYSSSLELEVRGRVDRVGLPSRTGGFFDDV
ncbi:hypothetical protein PR048_007505 [Dryococelus australis]|uniref:LMBR1 domain-containing protein 2 n=1 Tax=Dryococelus australis TaxID=614101 RepID=A0ABQ9HUP9_9NEOP|nr:hypothetical protein PR048_007505 [Dryococelus australis]